MWDFCNVQFIYCCKQPVPSILAEFTPSQHNWDAYKQKPKATLTLNTHKYVNVGCC